MANEFLNETSSESSKQAFTSYLGSTSSQVNTQRALAEEWTRSVSMMRVIRASLNTKKGITRTWSTKAYRICAGSSTIKIVLPKADAVKYFNARRLRFDTVAGESKYEAYVKKTVTLLTCETEQFNSDHRLRRTKSGDYEMIFRPQNIGERVIASVQYWHSK